MAGLILVSLVLLLSMPAQAVYALDGEVIYVEGEVSILHGSDVEPADIGSPVGQGDVLKTGADSLAVIRIGKGTDLKLREKTTLAFDSLGEKTSVTLKAGGLFSRVAKTLTSGYSVRAESAVAGVRGTEFFVAYGRTIDDRPDVWLCVNSGSVEVSIAETSQTVIVEEGKGINIIAGARLTTPKIYGWTQKLNWNTDPAGGRVRDETSLDQAYSDLLDQDYD